jgi:hypothetical protein
MKKSRREGEGGVMETTLVERAMGLAGNTLDIFGKRIEELEAERDKLRADLERMVVALINTKNKGDFDLCRCGRITGIYDITSIAQTALKVVVGEDINGQRN